MKYGISCSDKVDEVRAGNPLSELQRLHPKNPGGENRRPYTIEEE
jgi:hypothetical protein